MSPQHPPCDTSVFTDAPDPCQPFVLEAAADGWLAINAELPPTGTLLVLRVNGTVIMYGTSSLSHRLFVSAGHTVTFSVGLHVGFLSQPFQIMTELGPARGVVGLVLSPGGLIGATISDADKYDDGMTGLCYNIPCRSVSVVSPVAGYVDIQLWWGNTASQFALYVPTYADFEFQYERYCCEPLRPVSVAVRPGANPIIVGVERAVTKSLYFQMEASEVRATR